MVIEYLFNDWCCLSFIQTLYYPNIYHVLNKWWRKTASSDSTQTQMIRFFINRKTVENGPLKNLIDAIKAGKIWMWQCTVVISVVLFYWSLNYWGHQKMKHNPINDSCSAGFHIFIFQKTGNEKRVQELVRTETIDSVDGRGYSAAHWAAMKGRYFDL